ncbi:methionyl-tRNA synthetase, partial [Sticta canariensis]|nr:methionyl-tRNA synthetase [Sticta canariensis]
MDQTTDQTLLTCRFSAPHVGHLYSLVLADILKRWQVLQGNRAILCTGTDEHGMKIQQAAMKAKMDVRTMCDENAHAFDNLAKAADINRDHFIRTSDPDHEFAVQHFWLMLRKRGHIYQSHHEGWYSVSDETFYPESAVQLVLDPSTGRKFKASIETGKEVEWTSEKNYHFRMSAFKDRLLEFYSKNPTFILPSTRMQEVIDQVESGLGDLSISRSVERLSWGIPVPGDKSQTIYVWLDALINYLTKAKYPFQKPGRENEAGWPANCHVIGKDIVRFHCIYWPAFLMALDIPLPHQILTHAHWKIGRDKMSKSTGVTVNPFFALERFGVDTMRYFLALRGGIKDDANYDNSFVIEVYKTSLQGVLGNLVSRLVRGKGWNIRRAVQSRLTGDSEFVRSYWEHIEALPSIVANKMEKLDSRAALQTIESKLRSTNRFMQDSTPWHIVKGQNITATKQRQLDEIIYACAESLRICGILLQPYMPSKTKHLLDLLGVDPNARMFSNATAHSDLNYGTPTVDVGSGYEG